MKDNLAYPQVLTKRAYAPPPRPLQSNAENAAVRLHGTATLNNSRDFTAASPARFVFVLGLEGTGHHLLGQYFEACAHEIDTPPLQFLSRSIEDVKKSAKKPANDHHRPFCQKIPESKLWGRGFGSGFMGSSQAMVTNTTTWALDNIAKNVPKLIEALVQAAIAPEAAHRCERTMPKFPFLHEFLIQAPDFFMRAKFV